VLSDSDDDSADLTIAQGNDTQRTITLTCTAQLTGNVQVTGTKSITVDVIAAPVEFTAIDLGLPSGLKWANMNIGAEAPEGYGEYFSWGNVTGHKSTNGSTFDDRYNWGTNTGPYASTPGASIQFTSQHKNADYSATSGYDAARENLGGSWRMPTATEIQELYDNTDNEWTSFNGVHGRKFMKKSDHSVYVFFPAAGFGDGTSLRNRGSYGRYWSSSLSSAGRGYCLRIDSSYILPQDDYRRFGGLSVRAVQ
jgi:hypothetical protein